MEITLRHWQTQDAPALQQLCADVDRSYLSDRLPSPYTLEDARQWLSDVRIREEERQGIFRAIWADGRIVGNISIECQGGCPPTGRRTGLSARSFLLVQGHHDPGSRHDPYTGIRILRYCADLCTGLCAQHRFPPGPGKKTASPWKASPSMPSPKTGSSTTLISMRICAKITNDAFRHCKQREISL